jgi:hypothetical protein
VEVVKRAPGGSTTPIAQSSFTVAQQAGNVPRTNYSDLWWNPEQSGWGINLQQHPTNKIFATWFVYGLDNRPTWFVIPDGEWTSERTYTGAVYRTRGPFYQDTWNPALVSVLPPVGTATLTFTSYDSAVLVRTIDGITTQIGIVRQSF